MDINHLCPKCMNEMSGGECLSCGYSIAEPQDNTHALKPYTILSGKYLVGNVIGEGGFGITYIGFDLNLEMKIAIKEFYPNGFVTRESDVTSMVTGYTSNDLQQYQKWKDSFVREARNLAKFSNLPGIVHVRDFFHENNTAYIIMEYVEGQTLNKYLKLREIPLSVDETLEMMEPVIKSLSQVHEAGIIHRDISPDNIMIQSDGDVKLIDFGAAREFELGNERSMSVLLKPGYAPEEQYRSRGEQGPWTDVYALCATMYRCITGKKPIESMERMREDKLSYPSHFGIDIVPETENALMAGMAVYAEDRLRDMKELHYALYRGVRSKSAAIAQSKSYEAKKEIKHKKSKPKTSPKESASLGKTKKFIIAVSAFVIVLALIGFLAFKLGSKKLEPTVEPTPEPVTDPVPSEPVASPVTAPSEPVTTETKPEEEYKDWRTTYLELFENETDPADGYYFLCIDNDNIPEILCKNYDNNKEKMCTCKNGKASILFEKEGQSFWSYIEKSGKFQTYEYIQATNNNMIFNDYFYTFHEDTVKQIGKTTCDEQSDAAEYTDVYRYFWNDEETDWETVNSIVYDIYNFSKAEREIDYGGGILNHEQLMETLSSENRELTDDIIIDKAYKIISEDNSGMSVLKDSMYVAYRNDGYIIVEGYENGAALVCVIFSDNGNEILEDEKWCRYALIFPPNNDRERVDLGKYLLNNGYGYTGISSVANTADIFYFFPNYPVCDEEYDVPWSEIHEHCNGGGMYGCPVEAAGEYIDWGFRS